MTTGGRYRRIGGLEDAERWERPAIVRALTFEDLSRIGPTFRDTTHLVPIESAQPGDEQVLAAHGPRGYGEPIIDLDALADFPSVRSVVASTTVRARRPLPQIEELLLFGSTLVPDAETLRNLPALERFWAGWAPSDRPLLEVGALPPGLRALGVACHNLEPGTGARPRLAALTRLGELRQLVVNHCWPADSMAPLAKLTRLVRLRADAAAGWSALRACTELEEVTAIQSRLASLRLLGSWKRLRSLTLTGSGVRSLAGAESFSALERLRLVAVSVSDLSPLSGLPHVAEVELEAVRGARDLAALGNLPSLRRLAIRRLGVGYGDILHVDSLRPLATARSLEELVLVGTIVDDGDLSALAELPVLRRVAVFGDVEVDVADLRRARPDLEVVWKSPERPPGERVGPVFLRAPSEGLPDWWLSEDLTELLGTHTNADAEKRLRAALAADDAALLASRLRHRGGRGLRLCQARGRSPRGRARHRAAGPEICAHRGVIPC